MVDLRIVDAPEIPTEDITGEEKLPTGGSGNYSISLDSLADYTKTKKDLADNTSVDGKVNGVRQELDAHIEDLLNPHQVTKGQIGLGNVDNTADADKPVSNSTQSAIISAVAPKADKTYVDSQLALKANKADVYIKSETYTKQESNSLVNNSISTALAPVNSSLDLAKRGIANRYDSSLTYNSGDRVVLTNGDIVKSTIDGNTSNPNTDMTGWVLEHSATTVVLTLEMFGGKTIAQDPLFDNSDALDKMFKSYYPLHGVKTGITFTQLESAVQTSKRVVIQLNGMYRHTRPVDLPPNTTWQQPFEGYFAKAPSMGLFYDAIDLNSYAFGAVLYKKQPDLTYNLDTDVMTTVTGAQFDNGEYFMAAARQQLINPFIVTKRGVTLGYRLMGWAGNHAINLACGENNGISSRNPKVAILTGSCWGAKIDKPNTLSTHQGHVHIEAGGGFVVNEPYINSGLLDSGIDRKDVSPVYTVPNMSETGTIGLTQLGECYYHNPVSENWAIGHVSTHQFHIFRPHMERIDKYAHYLINCEGIIDFKGVTPVEAESVIYLKDYRTFDREVQVRGTLAMGGNLVSGENSDPSIVLDIARSHSFIQYYEWGDLNLIKSVQNKWGADIVYVDPVLGNDNYVGLRDIRAFRTLTAAKKLCDLFDIRNIQIMGDMEIPSGTAIPKKSTFLGAKLNLSGYLRVSDTGSFDIEFKNSQINSLTASNVILFSGDFHKGNLNITADINSPSSTLVQSTGSLDIDINIKNTTTNLSIIAFSQIYSPSGVGWNISTTNYNVIYNLDGGAYFKSIGTIGSGSLTVVSTPVAVGATQVFDISVPAARLGMPAIAFHDVYVDGISYTAVVKSSGIVSVMARNYSGVSVNIPTGALRAKVM